LQQITLIFGRIVTFVVQVIAFLLYFMLHSGFQLGDRLPFS